MRFSFLSNTTPEFVENQYKLYQNDPESVPAEWQRFFEGFDFASASYSEETASAKPTGGFSGGMNPKELNVLHLIDGYRSRGHLFAATNPVRAPRVFTPSLDLENFGLADADLDTVFEAGKEIGLGATSLRNIVAFLKETYCEAIAAEYDFIRRPELVEWLRSRMEATRNKPAFSKEKKLHLLNKVNEAVAFERFLHTKFVGQKRFSLEGGDALIPALDAIIQHGAEHGVEECIIGMAHRGRLNVLANIMQKHYSDIFSEFEGKGFEDMEDGLFQGDVKYHLGFSSDVKTASGKNVHLSLMCNPSHLETVAPVVQGAARCKIDRKYGDARKLAPIAIHGDAAVAGQGVVYETLQMSMLEGYQTGGTIHIVINNQIGFTTNYTDARSSTYCTDIAKITQSPVFHVNGDDVEELVYAIELAVEFRQTFGRDVFIDLLCYRRWGHNEGDEPSFTQPVLYDAIKKHPDPRSVYAAKLLAEGVINEKTEKEIDKAFRQRLQKQLDDLHKHGAKGMNYFGGYWEGLRRVRNEDFDGKNVAPTAVAKEILLDLVHKMHQIPADFNPHDKIVKLFEDRIKMLETDKLDWAMGELLAYATLLTQDNVTIRLSGQDCVRGTFSHRHVGIFDTKDEHRYMPINHLQEGQKQMMAYNSLLSEYAVMGFEYGYSSVNPHRMVIWEAQFGDFSNGAQIIIDQYLAVGETKWQRMNGLILMLPHGYEGQGPEHSSARIERYLELCANKNMQIINCTTPANYFHALRMQFKRDFRIPIIFFTPKKLLRYPTCVSSLSEFTQGGFQELIDDAYVQKPADVKRVLLCNGKIYYDLFEKQQELQRQDVAIVRLEQLYPLPIEQLREVQAKYKNAEFYWVQEEPRNMGAWGYMLRVVTELPLQVIARTPSPSPATGFSKEHIAQQENLVNLAFGLVKPEKVVRYDIRSS